MLEQLLQLVRQQGQEAVINNPAVPEDKKDGVIQEAGNAILSTLGKMSTSEQTEVMTTAAPQVTKDIQNQFCSSLMEKFGFNNSIASNIASALIPAVLDAIRNGKGGFNLQEVLQSLSSGALGKLGLDKEGGLGKMFHL